MIRLDLHSPEGWHTFLTEKPGVVTPGGAEIVCAGPHDPVEAAASWAAVLSQARDRETGDRLLVQVVVPPHAPRESVEVRFYETLVPTEPDEPPDEMEARREAARRAVPVVFQDSFDGTALTAELARAPARTLTLVLDADLYETGPATPRPDESAPNDWLWADRLARLAEAAVRAVRTNGGVIHLLSRRLAPLDRWSSERLLGVDHVGVVMAEDDEDSALRVQLDGLMRAASAGSPYDVLAEVDALGLDRPGADHVKAQILHSAGLHDEAYRLVRPHIDTLVESPDPSVLVKLGRIAQKSGHTDDARVYLRKLIEREPVEERPLATGAELAEGLGEAEIYEALIARLLTLYPNSGAVIRDTFYRCEQATEYGAFVDRYRPRVTEGQATDETRLYVRVAEALSVEGAPDGFDDLVGLFGNVEPLGEKAVPTAALVVASFELAHGRAFRALFAALAWEPVPGGPPERPRARIVLAAAEDVLAGLPDVGVLAPLHLDLLNAGLFAAADFVRRHPADPLRLVLHDLVSPDTSGPLGVAVFAALLDGGGPVVQGAWETPDLQPPLTQEDFSAIFRRLYEDAAANPAGAGMLGYGPAPWVGDHDARRVLDHVRRVVNDAAEQGADDAHRDLLHMLLHLGLLLTREVGRPGEGADLVGVVGAALAAAGHPQAARDLAERVFLVPT